MLDKNKQCKNCGFDTMAIVTVETSNWEYCPVCGSRFVSVKDDIEGNVDEDDVKMRDIPLDEDSEDGSEDQQSNNSEGGRKIQLNSDESNEESADSGHSETQSEEVSDDSTDSSDVSDEELDEMLDDSDFVEDELERLKKFVGDEDEDD